MLLFIFAIRYLYFTDIMSVIWNTDNHLFHPGSSRSTDDIVLHSVMEGFLQSHYKCFGFKCASHVSQPADFVKCVMSAANLLLKPW